MNGFVLSFFNPFYFAVSLAYLVYIIWWIPTIKLEMTNEGVTYQRGIKTHQLNWKDIKAISHRFHSWGISSDLDLFLFSNNPSKRDIKINEFYFTKEDFIELIAMLVAKGDRIEIDPKFISILNKKGWTGPKY